MDVGLRDAALEEAAVDEVHPAAGPAEVRLVAAQLGDELGEPLGVGDGLPAGVVGRQPRAVDRRSDEEEQPVSADGRQVLELVTERELRLVVGAVDDGDVAGAGVAVAHELLEDRADRRDADAGGEEQDAAADALASGEGAVGALEEDAGAGRAGGRGGSSGRRARAP